MLGVYAVMGYYGEHVSNIVIVVTYKNFVIWLIENQQHI